MSRKLATDTHCANGHSWDENLYLYPDGKRACKVCRMNSMRKHKGLPPIERERIGTWNRDKTQCPKGHPYDRVKSDGSRGCSQCHRNAMRNRAYGITDEIWQEMWDRQNGACAICTQEFETTPHVDHCHNQSTVRGLLCNNCNNGLGRFKDDPDVLEAAARYLRADIIL